MDTWTYYTRADGLPSDQIGCLAFDANGNLFAGTQCDGIATAKASDNYRNWRTVSGPSEEPAEPAGSGLPSNLINDILVMRDGTIAAATDSGLAVSSDGGNSWRFLRGADWAAKVRGRVGGAPKGWRAPPSTPLLAEDYITSLADDAQGRLWVGHRNKAVDCVDTKSLQPIRALSPPVFATCLLPGRANPLIASYGNGISGDDARLTPAETTRKIATAFPSGAQATLAAATEVDTPGKSEAASDMPAVYLGEDWSTEGDWVGRYGRQYAVLFAANWPFDQFISHGAIFYAVDTSNGPNHPGKRDVLRRWMGRRDAVEMRSLYDPQVGHRVQSEIDDHGEGYPTTLNGPDIHIWVRVPEGVNAVSLYFVNDDGRSAGNRDRDYLIGVARANALRDETAAPTLARARVHNFWGGVYERFALRGPAFYRFEIQKNHSMNAICSGLLIDRIAGPSTFVDGMALPSMGDTRYDPPPSPTEAAKAVASLAAATNLWSSADSIQFASPSLAREQQITACRLAANAGPADLAAWRWQSRLWNDDDRKGFDAATKEAWASFAQQLGINQASAR